MSKFEELVAAAQKGETDKCLDLMEDGVSIFFGEKSIFDFVSIVDDNFHFDTLSDIMDNLIQDEQEFPKLVGFLRKNRDLTNDLAHLDKSTVGYLIASLPQEREDEKTKTALQEQFNDIDANSNNKISPEYIETFKIMGGNFYQNDHLVDQFIKDPNKLDQLVNLVKKDENLVDDLVDLPRTSILRLIQSLPKEEENIKESVRIKFNNTRPEENPISSNDLVQVAQPKLILDLNIQSTGTSALPTIPENSSSRRTSVRRGSALEGNPSATTSARRPSEPQPSSARGRSSSVGGRTLVEPSKESSQVI